MIVYLRVSLHSDTATGTLKSVRLSYPFIGVSRHIDSARVYRNEAQVGEAVRQSGVPRGDIFVSA